MANVTAQKCAKHHATHRSTWNQGVAHTAMRSPPGIASHAQKYFCNCVSFRGDHSTFTALAAVEKQGRKYRASSAFQMRKLRIALVMTDLLDNTELCILCLTYFLSYRSLQGAPLRGQRDAEVDMSRDRHVVHTTARHQRKQTNKQDMKNLRADTVGVQM